MTSSKQRVAAAARMTADRLFHSVSMPPLSRGRARRRSTHGGWLAEPLEPRVLFTWIGATTGTTNDAAHNYNNTANWAGGVIDDSFNGVTLTASTTLYLSADRTTTTNGLNLNYSGNFGLVIESSSTTATRNLNLAGPVSGDFGGSANTQTVTLGDPTSKVLVNLQNGSGSFSVSGADDLVITNTVSGSASISKIGTGYVEFRSNNTYSGGTTIAGGRIESNIPGSGNLTPLGSGNVTITGSGTSGGQFYFSSVGGTNNATVANAFSISGIGFDSRGALRADGTSTGGLAILSGNITLTGAARIGTTGASAGSTGLISGVISGNYGLSSGRDAGRITIFSGANTYTGGLTVVAGGTVEINNTSGSGTGTGPVTVSSGGTLEGTGTISGAVSVSGGGTLFPGKGAGFPAVLHAGNVTFASGSTFEDEVDGSAVGNGSGGGYGQLVASGTPALGGATLNLIGSEPNNYGSSIQPISDTSTGAISGTFAGLPETGVFSSGGVEYVASYVGGDGNDLSLTYADPLSTSAITTAPYTVPGTAGTSTTLNFVSQSVGGTEFPSPSSAYQDELGFFIVSNSSDQVNGVTPTSSNALAYGEAALGSAGDQVLFSRGTPAYTLKQITLPAGTQIEFYLVQDATTAEYLSGTFPPSYAADGQQYPQSPQNGRPNVFFVNPLSNPGGANLFQSGAANTIYSNFYSLFDSTSHALPPGDGIFDFSINSPIVMMLTASAASTQAAVNLNWTTLANSGGYDILRTDNTTGAHTQFSVPDVNTTTYTDSTVQAGDVYTYQIAPAAIGTTAEHFQLPFSNTATIKLPGAISITLPSTTITGIAGQPVTINLPFTDTDPTDTLTGTMNWGDGTSASPDVTTVTVTEPSGAGAGSTPGTITGTQTYTTPGTYIGTLTTISADGITTTTSITVIISAPSPTPPVLTAADSSDNTAIDLNWTESQTNFISGYVIEREPAGGTFSVLTTVTNPATLSYADSTAAPGVSYGYEVEAYDTVGVSEYYGAFSNVAGAALPVPGPTVVSPATAVVSADGKSVVLNVLGADALGESSLTYTWVATTLPQGAAAPVIASNGTNAAESTTASISAIGTYTFTVTITDTASASATSAAAANVGRVLTAITVSPSSTALLPNTSQQFSASAVDQFGNAMASQPSLTWSVGDAALGTITSAGMFDAGSTYGTEEVEASAGAVSGTTSVAISQVSSSAPLAAAALDSSDIEAYWLDLPALSNGATLEESEDSTFATGVTSTSIPAHTTSFEASGLSPGTTSYFQLLPASGASVVGTASATTPATSSGGSGGPAAPIITAQASYTLISPTVISLTMTAASVDPLSYSWQTLSEPGGPPSIDDNSEQSTNVTLNAAGTYVFEATATDKVTGLSVTSDASVTIAEDPSRIEVSSSASSQMGSPSVFSALEVDQFNNHESPQPTLMWSVDPRFGAVSAYSEGACIFDPSGAAQGVTDIEVSAGSLSAAASVYVTGSRLPNLPTGSGVLTQHPDINFSSPGGAVQITAADVQVGAAASPSELDATFPIAVNNLTFKFVLSLPPGTENQSPQDLSLQIYSDGSLAGTMNVNSTSSSVNLSTYHDVTSIQINPDTAQGFNAAYYSDFAFNPVVLGLTARRTGDKFGDVVSRTVQQSNDPSQYVVLVNDNYDQNLASGLPDDTATTAPLQSGNMNLNSNGSPIDPDFGEIVLNVPSGLKSGTVALSCSNPSAVQFFKVDGTEVHDFTVDVASPSGDLQPLATVLAQMNVWFEGLKADPDEVVTLTYTNTSGNVIATDSIHMDIVEVAFINGSGTTLTGGVDSEPEEDLLAASGQVPGNYGQNSNTAPFTQDFNANLKNDEFRVVFQGLPSSNVQSFQQLDEAGNNVPIQTDPNSSYAETPYELVDAEDVLSSGSGVNTIKQSSGATVVQTVSSTTVSTAMDSFTIATPNDQTTADDDFFFDGTNNVPTDQTNVWEMRLEDTGQAAQAQAHYLLGTKDLITGWDCGSIASRAMTLLQQDLITDPNRTINIVGFSRGSAEAVDFANLLTTNLNDGAFFTVLSNGKEVAVKPSQVKIQFIGLYDLVTTIDGIGGNDGNLDENLPAGVGRVAHAVALSEERASFEFTDLSQKNPNRDILDQLGFRGVHSDIGGDAVNPGAVDQLTSVTLDWMNSEASSGGWGTLKVANEDAFASPATINGLTTPQYNALAVNQVRVATSVGPLNIYYPLQYRNFKTIDPNLHCWQPGNIPINALPLYTSQLPSFWNPNYAADVSNGPNQDANGA